MVNERMDNLEASLKDIQAQLKGISTTLSMGKTEAREEAYIGTEHSEGEPS